MSPLFGCWVSDRLVRGRICDKYNTSSSIQPARISARCNRRLRHLKRTPLLRSVFVIRLRSMDAIFLIESETFARLSETQLGTIVRDHDHILSGEVNASNLRPKPERDNATLAMPDSISDPKAYHNEEQTGGSPKTPRNPSRKTLQQPCPASAPQAPG